ncbi:MAG: CRISPR-associated helicase Cas3' [Gallionella sp.]|nr:MAG: CRISPR-associated helicase Cas3' [Gallionella sp.]
MADYWHECALPQAANALIDIGLLPRRTRPQTLVGLFDYLQPPTPLQQTAADIPLAAMPQLFILEDVTGAGKTEAALLLAHRLMQAGQADGFYFGLPTMATSNAMFRRLIDQGLDGQCFIDKCFLDTPSLVLAHSASRLAPALEALQAGGDGDTDYDKDEAAAAEQRQSWFADSRKKALLADAGVGTLDQALLAVLYSKHQSLRLLGLARKVLIVDEVHACDVYMLKLLEALLTFHAAAGGSAILLSATLPHATRATLARAYRAGLGGKTPVLQSTAYPLLTHIGQDTSDGIPLDTRPEVARTVNIDWVHTPDAAVAVLLAARAAGRCACWIRNTVDDAIAAFEALQKAGVPEVDLILFHARFALSDRSAIETAALNTFGPDSNAAQRRGKILICTQVVESSVDVDLDVMVSDLAPIDLIIQRAGRLCRHVRDAAGNRAVGNGRGQARLWLFGPAFVTAPAADWLSKPCPGTAAVYPDHGRLWLTAKLLRDAAALTMPEAARRLIEGVYGDESEAAIPPALLATAYKIEGENAAKQSHADANTVKLVKGYVQQEGIEPWDDTYIPTRLADQPSVTLRLACWETGALRPWVVAEKYAWELSQLSVRISLYADEAVSADPVLRTALEACRQTMPDKGRWSKLLVLSLENGKWVGQGKNRKGELVGLRYDERLGLRRA